jgi:hypothetical protein
MKKVAQLFDMKSKTSAEDRMSHSLFHGCLAAKIPARHHY